MFIIINPVTGYLILYKKAIEKQKNIEIKAFFKDRRGKFAFFCKTCYNIAINFLIGEKNMKKIIIIVIISIFSFSFVCQEAIATSSSTSITQARDFSKTAKNRKQVFINTLVPIINEIKGNIKTDKEKVENILKKEEFLRTEADKELLEENYEKYKVSSRTPQELLKKMVLPPTSLIIAQASVESGWGVSKLAQLGNNLFGMTSLSKSNTDSIKIGNIRYKKYAGIYESIEDYILTISRHNAYKSLRGGIRRGEDSVGLVKHLGSYSELGSKYSSYVAKVIRNNSLQKHDTDV